MYWFLLAVWVAETVLHVVGCGHIDPAYTPTSQELQTGCLVQLTAERAAGLRLAAHAIMLCVIHTVALCVAAEGAVRTSSAPARSGPVSLLSTAGIVHPHPCTWSAAAYVQCRMPGRIVYPLSFILFLPCLALAQRQSRLVHHLCFSRTCNWCMLGVQEQCAMISFGAVMALQPLQPMALGPSLWQLYGVACILAFFVPCWADGAA